MNKVLKYDDFYEAFTVFLMGRYAYSSHIEIGGPAPNPFVYSEIKIVLRPDGSGYVHALGEDSSTVDFKTMDHYRDQDMITPTQREEIRKMTQAKASKIVRQENIKLRALNKELSGKINSVSNLLTNGADKE